MPVLAVLGVRLVFCAHRAHARMLHCTPSSHDAHAVSQLRNQRDPLSGQAQLQEELHALGADDQGTKGALIDRLHALLAGAGVRTPLASPSPVVSCAHTPACHSAARPWAAYERFANPQCMRLQTVCCEHWGQVLAQGECKYSCA